MEVDGYRVMAETVTKLYHAVRVSGWFHHATDELVGLDVEVAGAPSLAAVVDISPPNPPVDALPVRYQTYSVQVLLGEDALDERHELVMRSRDGWTGRVRLDDLCGERERHYPLYELSERFHQTVRELPEARVLELGGRDRSASGTTRRFGDHEVVVVDIVAAVGVDVVGDAHELSSLFPPDHFDTFAAVSVFEHLLMPWRVVTELNRVLKPGGTGFVLTHQTIALHDMPWDFWRFSSTSWDALFNARTGFEILERSMDQPQYVIRHLHRPGSRRAEETLGFEASAVVVRKTGPCTVEWPVGVREVTDTAYPTG